MRTEPVDVVVQGTRLSGTLAAPETGLPGLLFLHGWNGSQEQDMDRAHAIAALGCVCLTFDLRGHVGTEALHASITPRDNLDDALAAYDTLATHPAVDSRAICVVGSSYGAYLAARPAFAPLTPAAWQTAVALGLAAVAGAAGGHLARAVAGALGPAALAARPVLPRSDQARSASANIVR